MRKVLLIATVDEQDGIGINNKIPLKIPQAVDHIKKNIRDTVSIVGRESFEQIGNIYAPKTCIMLSGSAKPKDGLMVERSPEDALAAAIELSAEKSYITVLGGEKTFNAFLSKGLVDEILTISIDGVFGAQKFFKFDKTLFNKQKQSEEYYYSGFSFWFTHYKRKITK